MVRGVLLAGAGSRAMEGGTGRGSSTDGFVVRTIAAGLPEMATGAIGACRVTLSLLCASTPGLGSTEPRTRKGLSTGLGLFATAGGASGLRRLDG